ncbi:MAG: hypothetical protein JWL73_1642 [Actinomycetia bacterium]|nr:hypothetical protein [Actinomycetes bacterium]
MDTSPATGPVGSDPIPTPVTDAARRLSQLSFGVAGLAISAGRHLAERTRQAAAPHASSDAAMGTAPFDTAPFDTATVGTSAPPVPAPPVPSSLVTVPPKVGPVGLVGGALLGAGYVAQARILDVSAAVEVRTTKLSRRLLAAQGARGAAARPPSIVVRRLEPWFEIGAAHQAHSEAAVAATVSRLVPDMLDAAIAGIDLPRLLRRLPIDEMLDDLLDEIDLNALLARIDLDALLDRVDLDSLLRKVDIGAIVLGSTGTVTTEAVDASRGLAVRADTLVSRVTDKVLFRRGGRRLGVEGFDRIAPALGPKPKPAAIDVIGGPAPVDRRED